MSHPIEHTPLKPTDDNERLSSHEQLLEEFRSQLDSRLSAPDLNDDQRNKIIEEAIRRVRRLSTYEDDIELYRLELENKLSDPSLSEVEKDEILERAVNNTDISLDGAYGEMDATTRWLLKVVDPTAEYDGRITPHHQQAMKYYSGTLFELIRSQEAKGNDEAALNATSDIYSAYFSSSPNITTYTGGVSSQLELLSYAERSPRALSITHNLSGEIIYNGAFSGDNSVFTQTIASKEPIPQLEILNTASRLAVQANYQGEWATPFSQKVLNELSATANMDSVASPFIRIAASAKASTLESELNAEWRDLSEFTAEEQKLLIEKDRLWKEQDALSQQILHEEFPAAGNGYLRAVSNNAVAEIGPGFIDMLTTRDGKQVRLTDIEQRNDLDLTYQDAVLLKAVHDTSIRQAIEGETGINLAQLSLDTQRHLLTFMIEASPERYSRLIQALDGAGERRLELAEAFLATEFGGDYGNVILEIVETKALTEEMKSEFLQQIIQMRGNILSFADKISALSGEAFANNVRSRFTNRVTDSLYGIKYYIDNGHSEENIKMGSMNVPVSVSEKEIVDDMRTLDNILTSLAAIKISVSPVSSENNSSPVEFGYIDGTNDSVLLATKPHYGKLEDGMIRGSKPRANFMVGVDGLSPSMNMAERDRQAVSVRLDLDGDGILRLDIGGKPLDYNESDISTHTIRTPDFAVAKLISLGNWYRSRQIGSDSSDYHVDLQPMSTEEFANAIESIRSGIEYSSSPLRITRKQGEVAVLSTIGDLNKAA